METIETVVLAMILLFLFLLVVLPLVQDIGAGVFRHEQRLSQMGQFPQSDTPCPAHGYKCGRPFFSMRPEDVKEVRIDRPDLAWEVKDYDTTVNLTPAWYGIPVTIEFENISRKTVIMAKWGSRPSDAEVFKIAWDRIFNNGDGRYDS